MRIVISLSIIAVSITLALAFAAAPASAASPSRCQAYAADAAKAAQQVRQLQCGFDLKDDRWSSTDPGPHQRCLSASDDDVDEERKERDADVNRCKVCKDYAGGAVAENHDNIKYHCGFTGDRWSSNEQAHFAWCMANANETHVIIEGNFSNLSVNILDYEDDQRADELGQCYVDNGAKIGFCNQYVDQTRADAKYVAKSQNGCDFKYEDDRYRGSDDVRFEWCFNLGTGTPGGDPNYKTKGEDPVSFLHEVVTGCQRRARARAVLHSPPRRPSLTGGQGFSGNAKSGARDGSLIDRVKQTTPTTVPGGGSDSLGRVGAGGGSAMDRLNSNTPGGGSQSGRATGGTTPPKLLAPALTAPAGVGAPLGGAVRPGGPSNLH